MIVFDNCCVSSLAQDYWDPKIEAPGTPKMKRETHFLIAVWVTFINMPVYQNFSRDAEENKATLHTRFPDWKSQCVTWRHTCFHM